MHARACRPLRGGFGVEAFLYATHISNVAPTSTNGGLSPTKCERVQSQSCLTCTPLGASPASKVNTFESGTAGLPLVFILVPPSMELD